MSPIAEAVHLLKALYLEMPGCSLTAAQMARLSGLDVPTCEAIVSGLIEARFLRSSERGTFVRASDGPATSQ